MEINYRSPYTKEQTTRWRKEALKRVVPFPFRPYIKKVRGGTEFSSLKLAMELVHFRMEKGTWEYSNT